MESKALESPSPLNRNSPMLYQVPPGHPRPTRLIGNVQNYASQILTEKRSQSLSLDMDLHICGICKEQFITIETFLAHKQAGGCCSNTEDTFTKIQGEALEETDCEEDEERQTQILRSRLLGLAEAARESDPIDTEETQPHYEILMGPRELQHDEEDVADVLINQLSGPCPPQGNDDGLVLTYPSRDNSSGVKDSTDHVRVLVMESLKPKTTKENNAKNLKNKKDKKITVGKKKHCCSVESCNYATSFSKDMIRHMRTHTGERPFQCHQCKRCFSRGDKLNTHLRIHSGEKPFRCKMCNYAAVDSSSLTKHLRTHTNERPCKCQICPYRARDTSQLTVHLRIHTGDLPFSCTASGCSSAFKTSSDLKRHFRLHTGEKPYACDTCSYKCRIKSNLAVHIRKCHMSNQYFSCEHCDFLVYSKKVYINHLKTHENASFSCKECNYTCHTRSSLLHHNRLAHRQTFMQKKCKVCSIDFKSIVHCKHHMENVHNVGVQRKSNRRLKKVKKFEPDVIKVKEQNLSKASKMFGVRPHKCSECNVAFVREDSLRAHIRMHLKQRSESQQEALESVQIIVPAASTFTTDNNSEHLLLSVPPKCPDKENDISHETNFSTGPSTSSDHPPADSSATSSHMIISLPSSEKDSNTQQVLFYVPSSTQQVTDSLVDQGSSVAPTILLDSSSAESSGLLVEQLSVTLQDGVHYILLPPGSAEAYQVSGVTTFQQ